MDIPRPRTPISENSNVLRGSLVGTSTRSPKHTARHEHYDKAMSPTRPLEKENEAQPAAQAMPRHATPEPSQIKASRQGHRSSARSQGGRGALLTRQGLTRPAQLSGFQVKIPMIPEDDADRGPSPRPTGPTPQLLQSHPSLMCRRGAPEPSLPCLADYARSTGCSRPQRCSTVHNRRF